MKIPVSSIFSLSLNVADDLVTVFIIHIVDFQLVARCLCQYFETISSQLMNFWKSCEKCSSFLYCSKITLEAFLTLHISHWYSLCFLAMCCFQIKKKYIYKNTLFTGIFLVISSFFNDFTVFNWFFTWLLNKFIKGFLRWRISLLF